MRQHLSSLLLAVLATLLYLLVNELIGIWGVLAESAGFENYYKYYLLIQGALQTIAVLIFIYFIKKRTLKNLIRETHYKWYLFALALGISFVFIQTPLKWIYNLLFGTEYHIAYRFDGLTKFKNINLISSIILIPIGEELFFREYIQHSLQKKTKTIIAILFASLLFALIHSPYMSLFFDDFKENWHLSYLTFFGGLLSGVLYYKSKSIRPSILFHIFWNLTVTIV